MPMNEANKKRMQVSLGTETIKRLEELSVKLFGYVNISVTIDYLAHLENQGRKDEK